MRVLPTSLVWLLGACAVGRSGPATPGSPAATDLDDVKAIADEAAKIDKLAAQLQIRVDDSRGHVDEHWTRPDDEVEQMRALSDQITQANDDLQKRMKALEEKVHSQAGDPAWPPEPLKDKRR